MATIVTILTVILRLVGLAQLAEKLLAAHQARQATKAAADAEKAVVDEDARKLAIAAAPDRSPDDILARMSDGAE